MHFAFWGARTYTAGLPKRSPSSLPLSLLSVDIPMGGFKFGVKKIACNTCIFDEIDGFISFSIDFFSRPCFGFPVFFLFTLISYLGRRYRFQRIRSSFLHGSIFVHCACIRIRGGNRSSERIASNEKIHSIFMGFFHVHTEIAWKNDENPISRFYLRCFLFHSLDPAVDLLMMKFEKIDFQTQFSVTIHVFPSFSSISKARSFRHILSAHAFFLSFFREKESKK